MSAIINGSSPSVTFSDGTTQATSAIVSGYVPYANLPAGSVLQVVQGTLTGNFSTTSSSYVATGLTVSITPKFSTSKILVMFTGNLYIGSNSINLWIGLHRSTTKIFESVGIYNNIGSTTALTYLDSPSTTSSTAYNLYIKSNGSVTGYLNQDSASQASITVMEIAG